MKRRALARAGLAVGAAMLALGGVAAQPAAAAPAPIENWQINGTTHIGASINTDVQLAGGTFNGTIDTETGALTGNVTFPQLSFTFNAFGILPTTVQFEIEQHGEMTGNVDLTAGTVEAEFPFDIHLTSVNTLGFLELVTPDPVCTPVEDSVASLSGSGSLAEGIQLTGTYEIAPIEGCGFWGGLISSMTASPTNTLDLRIAPGGAAPPPPGGEEPPPHPH